MMMLKRCATIGPIKMAIISNFIVLALYLVNFHYFHEFTPDPYTRKGKNYQGEKDVGDTKEPLIPRILWINEHKINDGESDVQKLFDENVAQIVHKYENAWNNDTTVELEILSSDKCKAAISKLPFENASTRLLSHFLENDPLNHVCHIAVLFLNGGYFIQSGVDVIEPFILPANIPFVAVTYIEDSMFHGSFLASSPRHPFLKRALEKYNLLAKGELKLETTELSSRFGEIMRLSYHEHITIYPEDKKRMILLSATRFNHFQRYDNKELQGQKESYNELYCNCAITEHGNMKSYFHTRFSGESDVPCNGRLLERYRQSIDSSKITIKADMDSSKIDTIIKRKSPESASSIKAKKSLIPPILWVNVHRMAGRNSDVDKMLDENIDDIIHKYKEAWKNHDAVKVNTLTMSKCTDTISKLPLDGAATDLLDYFLKHDPLRSICYIAVLFSYGGYYVPRDVKVIEPFITPYPISFTAVTNPTGMFQGSFLAAAPHHPLLHNALQNYIKFARNKVESETVHSYDEMIRLSFNEVVQSHPSIRSNIVLLSTKHLHEIQHYDEYQRIEKQDGEGPSCDNVIVDDEKKQVFFFTVFAGANGLCRKIN